MKHLYILYILLLNTNYKMIKSNSVRYSNASTLIYLA